MCNRVSSVASRIAAVSLPIAYLLHQLMMVGIDSLELLN
jgi:hypothetical protein